MLYTLLGRLVWKGGKLFLRRRYGRAVAPKALIGGAAVAVTVAGVVLALKRRGGDDSAPSR